jgi:hypothetical protein
MLIASRNCLTWLAAGPRFIFLGWIALLLLVGTASGQSAWPMAEIKSLTPGETVLKRVIFCQPDRRPTVPGSEHRPADLQRANALESIPADLGQKPDNLEKSRRRLARTSAQNSVSQASGSSWQSANWQCPLPPASAFSLQTNLRKYLETWPTPGATVARGEPAGNWEFDEDDLH